MSFLRSKREYRYSVLEFQPSLKLPRSERLALILEGPDTVVVVGRDSSRLRGVSEVARGVLEQLPTLLMQQVEAAVNRNDGVNVLAELQASNRWNIFFGKADTVRSETDPLQLAFQLFFEYVVR